MNKQEFLMRLCIGLSGLPQEDIEERLAFYEEMIDDRIEEGASEQVAVSELGTVNEVISQILADIPLTKLVKQKIKPRRALRAWEIILIVLGSPIWLSLLIAVFAVVFAVYVAIWSVAVALWAVEITLAVCPLGLIAMAIIFVSQGNGVSALAVFSIGIFCMGVSIFAFFGCKAFSKAILLLTRKTALGIKTLFVGKRKEKLE